MGTRVKFEWYPSLLMAFIMVIFVLYIWKLTWDFFYIHKNVVPVWLDSIILIICPFVYFFLIYNGLERVFKLIYGKAKDDI